ncbi:hypothetical protein FNV43_RR17156 [Rhamnella rubrinervis]|uniref:Uncharacterized protein n=1 Tax=Rhamnella rubrinervis TaxID=2594499 RepID=A0A8K0GV77_9ROSA|nr:hypothetical protein FNV43_RR17156 [Rhamnella rubrinervis]
MKVRILTDVELAEKERKKKEKKAAQKAGGSVPSQHPEPTSGGTIFVQWNWLKIADSSLKCHSGEQIAKRGGSDLKQITVDATSRVELPEKNWSKAKLNLSKKEKELESLRLDFTRIASERDELQTQAAAWPYKKRIIYPRKDMISRFKVRETNSPTPEPSEDEDDNNESMEISSGEEETEEAEENMENNPKNPLPSSKKTFSPLEDLFEKAMALTRAKRTGPGMNVGEASSSAQPNPIRCWYTVICTKACSLNSSKPSIDLRLSSLFVSCLARATQSVGMATFVGITAFVPLTTAKGVSLVALCGVVRSPKVLLVVHLTTFPWLPLASSLSWQQWFCSSTHFGHSLKDVVVKRNAW